MRVCKQVALKGRHNGTFLHVASNTCKPSIYFRPAGQGRIVAKSEAFELFEFEGQGFGGEHLLSEVGHTSQSVVRVGELLLQLRASGFRLQGFRVYGVEGLGSFAHAPSGFQV